MKCKTAIAGQPCGRNAVRGHDLCKKHLALARELKWNKIIKESKDAKDAREPLSRG